MGIAQRYDLVPMALQDLSPFKAPGKNWVIAGDVIADMDQDQVLKPTAGVGVLVNMPTAQDKSDLFFTLEHGDLDIEMEVMMARHSNSGIYLQGRYEIQLLDSWGKHQPSYGDMVGVYRRCDDTRPEGDQRYGGIPPRLNAARAPGLWQKLRIEFQAPRFDAAGRKTEPAKLIRLVLNGVTVHEQVILAGPTCGSFLPGEAALGPLVVQGDHGPVAFRNIRYRNASGKPVSLRDLSYKAFSGPYGPVPLFDTIRQPAKSGKIPNLTWEVAESTNEFAVQYKGKLDIPMAGKHWFTLYSHGNSSLKVNGQTLVDGGFWTRAKSIDLPAGTVDIEVGYAKVDDWIAPVLSLFVEGPLSRPTPLHAANSAIQRTPVNPILREVGQRPELVRCFFDIPKGTGTGTKRVVHALSIGHPQQTHYAYDLDNGALFQVWRGGFLDATPMWHDRGDGHADPMGSVLVLGNQAPLVQSGAIGLDTLPPNAQYRARGYELRPDGQPTLRYSAYGLDVTDKISVEGEGKFLGRELTFAGTPTVPVVYKLATGKKIVQLASNRWSVDDKLYFVETPDATPQVQTVSGEIQALTLPLGKGLKYRIVW